MNKKGVRIVSLKSTVMIKDQKETRVVPKDDPELMKIINEKLIDYLKND